MASSAIQKHYLRILGRWPKDILRPDISFEAAIQRRINQSAPSTPATELKQVNALYSLLENRYKSKYPLGDAVLKPASNPTYYTDLMTELAEAPGRSWWQRTLKRWSGYIRFS